jgi:NAD(P)-dependent dehydrogenase (short-subunit alcohol dehydrogenase family)
MHPLTGKVVLITGASSGIGRETALRLAGHGARLVVTARNGFALDEVVQLAQAAGSEALAVPTDVGDAEACRHSVEATIERFGMLDILVCCAGISMRAYFEASDVAAMEKVMRVNFFGTLYMTSYALPHVKRQRGSLVAISSLAGKRGVPSYAVYGASKFAVHGLYESLRGELKRSGVHVGIVSPGFLATPLHDHVLGPQGDIWRDPPAPPFRVWPVARCVDKIVRLIVRRRKEALLPWFAGPLLQFDQALGCLIGDAILARSFPPDTPETGFPTNPKR